MHTLDTVVQDPHLNAVGMFEVVEHPTEGAVRLTRVHDLDTALR